MANASAQGDTALKRSKLQVAEFFAEHVLSQVDGLAKSVAARDHSIMMLPTEEF